MVDIKKSAEVVDKLINHVCYKKTEGKLYLMTERLGWMTNTSEQFKISESYKNIRMQRISPDDKDKVQLQLLIYSGSSYTFHFVHPDGRDHQLRDRNEVKNHLQHILPKFKDKATSELEHKKKLCERNPQVLDLYRELVAGKYICKEEFWERMESVTETTTSADNDGFSRGVPSCLMTVLPESVGANEKYNLSDQMIEDIFHVYPSVRQKYNSIVKSEKDRYDFWKRFFQSHYSHRTRSNLSQDIFVSCANQDITEVRKAAHQLQESSSYKAIDCPSELAVLEEEVEMMSDANIANYTSPDLLNRFNRHTFMLLEAMVRDKKATKRPTDNIDLDSESLSKKARLLDTADEVYNDSETRATGTEVVTWNGVPFNTAKVTEYINQISEVNSSAHNSDRKRVNLNNEEQRQRLISLKKALLNVVPNRPLVCLTSSSVATDVLTTVGHLFSNADVTLSGFGQSGRSLSTVPTDMEKDIKSLYRVVSELLRHFWACFPVIDSAGFEKLHRLKDSIKKFREQRLETFNQAHSNYYVLTGSMENKATDHLATMLDTALDAFARYMANYVRLSRTKELQ